jgi:hypothetical protein
LADFVAMNSSWFSAASFLYLAKQLILGVPLFAAVAFGFGMNGHFPAWAFCYVPLVLTILLFAREEESWLSVVLKHVWVTLIVTLGYMLAFIGAFSSSNNGTDPTSMISSLVVLF